VLAMLGMVAVPAVVTLHTVRVRQRPRFPVGIPHLTVILEACYCLRFLSW
jgi:hypothetical protein